MEELTDKTLNFNNEEEDEVRLGFIKLIGEESDGDYRYEFIFTDNIDEFWGDNFEYKPACLVNSLMPYDNFITEVHVVKMKIKLDLIQDSCCFGFQDCADGIVSLGWQNLDQEEEYPEDGRIFFRFGETLEDVKNKLAIKNVLMVD
jgi:hypothetical protein